MALEHVLRREEILKENLITLAGSPLQKNLLFQGGGALHFVYSSPRYSGDLDFVDPTITQDIQQYLSNLLTVGSGYEINRGKLMSSGRGVRMKWGHKENEAMGIIEIDERANSDGVESSKWGIKVKTPQGIYTDKIFANIARLVTRRDTPCKLPFKPNDLYDLGYILDTLGQKPPKKEDILAQARSFNQEEIVTPSNLSTLVGMIRDKNNHPLFRDCIQRSMNPDVYRVLTLDRNYFNKSAEHFEQYL